MTSEVGEVLIPSAEIEAKVRELGERITEDYRGEKPLLVGILRGAVVVMSDLMRRIELQCEIDFMEVSSYGMGTASSGVVRILKDLRENIMGRHVLIVEDIVDTGLTLSYLRRSLLLRKPASLEICSLLSKPSQRRVELDVRYVGFEVPDEFVVGYGIDYAGSYRNLPDIYVMSPVKGDGWRTVEVVDVLLSGGWVAALGHHGAPTVAGVAPETSLTLAEADRMLSALAAKGHLTKGHLTKGHLKVRVAPGRLLYSLRGGDARL